MYETERYDNYLKTLGDRVTYLNYQNADLEKTISNKQSDLNTLSDLIVDLQQTLQLLSEFTYHSLDTYINNINNFLARFIEVIDPEYPYTIKLTYAKSEGITNKVTISVSKIIDEEVVPLIKSSGEGFCALVSILLYIYFHLKFRKSEESYMFLDEALAAVSENYHEMVAYVLRTLSKEYNINILLITHLHTLARLSDNILEMTSGYAQKVKEIHSDVENVEVEEDDNDAID